VAWNEPAVAGERPLGQRRKEQGPPDLDQILKNIRDRLSVCLGWQRTWYRWRRWRARQPHRSRPDYRRRVRSLAAVRFLRHQSGRTRRGAQFGKKNEVTGPGLHWRLPWPIERVEKVNVDQVSTLSIGRRGDKGSGGGVDSGFMLTRTKTSSWSSLRCSTKSRTRAITCSTCDRC